MIGPDDALEYFPPPDAGGGWRTLARPDEISAATGMDKAKLDAAFSFVKSTTRHGGLLVARRGWLIYERYFGLGQRDAMPNLASCGKSFTSIAMGQLLAERPDAFPGGLEQHVINTDYLPAEAFPLADPAKAEIMLGQLLAFSAGIRGNNPAYVQGRQIDISPIGPDGWQAMVDRYALGMEDGQFEDGRPFSTRTLWCPPGGGYSYATAAIHLVSILLRRVAGVELQQYIRQRLAEPMGWGRWGFGYRHIPEIDHTPGGGGIAMRGTDMLRFGYLLLRQGRWGNQQLVPAEYIRHCASPSPYNRHFPYSLQFTSNGTGLDSELPRDAYWKAGSGGHAIYVVPSLDLVVWKLGGRDQQYSPENTGLPLPPPSEGQEPAQEQNATSNGDTGLLRTLRLVVAAAV